MVISFIHLIGKGRSALGRTFVTAAMSSTSLHCWTVAACTVWLVIYLLLWYTKGAFSVVITSFNHQIFRAAWTVKTITRTIVLRGETWWSSWAIVELLFVRFLTFSFSSLFNNAYVDALFRLLSHSVNVTLLYYCVVLYKFLFVDCCIAYCKPMKVGASAG